MEHGNSPFVSGKPKRPLLFRGRNRAGELTLPPCRAKIAYDPGSMLATRIVLLLESSFPVTFTVFPSNCFARS